MSGFFANLARAAPFIAIPSVAFAHIGPAGPGYGDSFAHGLAHPLGGLDHLLAMVAVGLIAAQLGRRALWLVPLSFVTLMALGWFSGTAGIDIPLIEIVIALSVIVFGLALAVRSGVPILAAVALVGFFAVFHGYAHAAEMPYEVSALAYAAGFVAATALLHGVGIGLGLSIGRLADLPARALVRCAGGAMALGGIVILSGLI